MRSLKKFLFTTIFFFVVCRRVNLIKIRYCNKNVVDDDDDDYDVDDDVGDINDDDDKLINKLIKCETHNFLIFFFERIKINKIKFT